MPSLSNESRQQPSRGVYHGPEDVITALAGGSRVKVLLDFDGTCAELTPWRSDVKMNPAVADGLALCRATGRIDELTITGRPDWQIVAFRGGPGVYIVLHGAEEFTVDAQGVSHPSRTLDRSYHQLTATFAGVLERELIAAGYPILDGEGIQKPSLFGARREDDRGVIEIKNPGVALHTFPAEASGKFSPERMAEFSATFREALKKIAREQGLVSEGADYGKPVEGDLFQLKEGSRVFELAPNLDRMDKGRALLRRYQDHPEEFEKFDLILVAGDDKTDLDMMRGAAELAKAENDRRTARGGEPLRVINVIIGEKISFEGAFRLGSPEQLGYVLKGLGALLSRQDGLLGS